MKITNFKISKELYEAKFPQDLSEFYYGVKGGMPMRLYAIHNGYVDEFGHWHQRDEFTEFYAAPTVDEILEQFPEFIDYDGKIFEFFITHEVSGWNVALTTKKDFLFQEFMEDSIVDAAARMYLYLENNNLMSHKQQLAK